VVSPGFGTTGGAEDCLKWKQFVGIVAQKLHEKIDWKNFFELLKVLLQVFGLKFWFFFQVLLGVLETWVRVGTMETIGVQKQNCWFCQTNSKNNLGLNFVFWEKMWKFKNLLLPAQPCTKHSLNYSIRLKCLESFVQFQRELKRINCCKSGGQLLATPVGV